MERKLKKEEIYIIYGFPGGSDGKGSTCNARDSGLIPGLGRSLGEGKGYPLQYSGLENPMDCIVYGVTKSWRRLSDFHFHTFQGLISGWGRSPREGKGHPLQYTWPEIPWTEHPGKWHVHGVAKESDATNMYTIVDSLCCTVETNATLQSNYTPIQLNLKKWRIPGFCLCILLRPMLIYFSWFFKCLCVQSGRVLIVH